MKIITRAVGENVYELHDDFGENLIKLTSIPDADGSLRMTATVDEKTADLIRRSSDVYSALKRSFI